MIRQRYPARLILLLTLLISAAQVGTGDSRYEGSPLKPSRFFGASAFKHEDFCYVLEGSFSDDFIDGLKINRKRGDTEFEKAGVRLLDFPDEIGVLISASSIKCKHDRFVPEPAIALTDLKTLHFDIRWLGADGGIPIEPELIRTVWAAPNMWYFTVPSKNIPLSSEIKIEVLTAKQVRVATLKGELR